MMEAIEFCAVAVIATLIIRFVLKKRGEELLGVVAKGKAPDEQKLDSFLSYRSVFLSASAIFSAITVASTVILLAVITNVNGAGQDAYLESISTWLLMVCISLCFMCSAIGLTFYYEGFPR